VLTCNGVKPQVSKIEALMKLAVPKTVKQVRSFIGMINYYNDLIPHRSELLTPLTTLTKKMLISNGMTNVQKVSNN
jgi:hypothetical protein